MVIRLYLLVVFESDIFHEKFKNLREIKKSQYKPNNWVICGYFFIVFFDFMCKGKRLTDFRYSFSQIKIQKSNKIALDYSLKKD